MPCRNLTGLQLLGAINIFQVFHSTVHSKDMSVGVRLTGNRHIHTTYRFKLAVLTHTHKYIHTQSARAVLPKGLILVIVCFTMSMSDIYISRCSHLLSIQSPAGTVLSFQLAPVTQGWLCLSYCFQQPASRSKVSSPSSSLRNTNQLCLEQGDELIS